MMSFLEYVEDFEKKDGNKKPNHKLVFGVVAFAIILIAFVIFQMIPQANATSFQISEAENIDNSEIDVPSKKICVHVSGEVLSPGICYLDEGSRVMAAIEACGGFSENASTDSLNLARELQDGEQIKVISTDEALAQTATPQTTDMQTTAAPSSTQDAASTKVNINTATLSELQTLSGIGASKAQKIIDYRESNGSFKSIDDLVNVSGIGEKTLASIKDSICV